MSPIERENELARLTDLLSESMQGRGRVAMITGPTATGKTELMHAFSEQAVDSGVTWLSATCSRAEQNLSLGTVSQIFHSAALPPDSAAHVARLLENAASHAEHSESQPEGLEWLHVTQGLWSVILDLSRTNPLLITVDDVNYADSLSWRLVVHFVNRLKTANVLIVMTATEWPEGAELPVDADLMHHPHCHRFKVASLSPDGVTRLLARDLGESAAEELGPSCYEISGGNPCWPARCWRTRRARRDRSPSSSWRGTRSPDRCAACCTDVIPSCPASREVWRSSATTPRPPCCRSSWAFSRASWSRR
ncbi:AAA family ATPase [Nonomuraea antimicrobica]